MHPFARAAWLAAVFVAGIPVVGRAQPTRIALSGVTAAPSGTFSRFDRFPSVSVGVVAFRGLYSGNSQQGIFTGTGGALTAVVTSASGSPFTSLGMAGISGSTTVFPAGQAVAGAPTGIPFGGVYAAHAPGIVAVADTTTISPAGGTFGGFGDAPAVSGTTVAFLAWNPNRAGVYTAPSTGGSVTPIAQTGEAIPQEAANFTQFLPPSVSGNRVALAGSRISPSQSRQMTGVYTAATTGGPLAVVANTGTLIPDGGGARFSQFDAPAISGDVVAFGASGGSYGGIYATTGPGGALARVADTTTLAPGANGPLFDRFHPEVSRLVAK